MEKVEIATLMALSERIQDRILEERNEKIKSCLNSDLEKVKMVLAQKIFDLPLDSGIFLEDMNVSMDLQYTDLSLDVEQLDSTDAPHFEFTEDDVSAIKEDSILEENNSKIEENGKNVHVKLENVPSMFEQYLKSKAQKKSRLPIRTQVENK